MNSESGKSVTISRRKCDHNRRKCDQARQSEGGSVPKSESMHVRAVRLSIASFQDADILSMKYAAHTHGTQPIMDQIISRLATSSTHPSRCRTHGSSP
jgi:hypothetical protein